MNPNFLLKVASWTVIGGLVGFALGGLGRVKDDTVAEKAVAVPMASVEGEAAMAESGHMRKINDLLLADRDPERALAKLEAESADGEWVAYRDRYVALFSAWAHRDMDGALSALEEVDRRFLPDVCKAVLEVAYEQDPDLAIELLVEFQNDLSHTPSWLSNDPELACRLVPRLRGSQIGGRIVSSAAATWAESDPKAAFAWAQSLGGSLQYRAIGEVLGSWAQNDLEGAIEFYEAGGVTGREAREGLENEIAKAYGNDQPAEAIGWLRKMQEARGRDDAIQKIVKEWAKRDLDAAVAWAEAQPGRDGRLAGRLRIDSSLAEGDSKEAADVFLEGDAVEQSNIGMAKRIANQYILDDPVAALDWVDQLPGSVRARTESDMFTRLFHQDREVAVAEFDRRMERLSASTVGRFSAEFFKADVEAAKAWLETVPPGTPYKWAHNGIYTASREGGGEGLVELARQLSNRD